MKIFYELDNKQNKEYRLIYWFLKTLYVNLDNNSKYYQLIYGENKETTIFTDDIKEVLQQKHNKNGKQMSEELKAKLNEYILERL